jgi:hypothetical protein
MNGSRKNAGETVSYPSVGGVIGILCSITGESVKTPDVVADVGIPFDDTANSPLGRILGSEVILIPDGTPVGEFADPGGPDNFSGFDSMKGNTFKVGPPIGIVVIETGVDNTGITAVADGEVIGIRFPITGESVKPPDVVADVGIPFDDTANSPLGRILGSEVILIPDDTPVGKLADPEEPDKFTGFDSMDGNMCKVGACVGISFTEIGVETTGLTEVPAGCTSDDTTGVVVMGDIVPMNDQIAGERETLLRSRPFAGWNVGLSVSDANSSLRRIFGSKVVFKSDDSPVGKYLDP